MMTSNQSQIEFDGETISVDATLIAESLGIEPAVVQPLMREGRITSRCERGVDEDEGRYRLTFFHGRLRALLVIDADGRMLTRTIEAGPLRGRSGSSARGKPRL